MSKNKKPFPFKVCEECCNGSGTGGDITIDSAMSDTSENPVQNKVIKAYVDGGRTHYSESVLLCDYTHTLDSENWEGEDYGGTFVLDKEVEPDALRLYINGEYVPVKYQTEDNIYYTFYANAEENDIFTYNKSDNSIAFFPWIAKANYQLYSEIVHQLEEKYIPDSIPKKAIYEKDFIGEYIYDSADFEGDFFPGIVVNKKLTGENLAFYVNGEKVTGFYVEYNPDEEGYFWGISNDWEHIYFAYNFNDDTIAFYPEFADGTVVQIYEENFDAIKDSDISNSIARTQYVDRLVDGKIGDIDTALDGIIALQESLIGGGE